jgi:hypothetical protein
MNCPKCGAVNALRVIVTERRSDGTHRWYRCRCGFRQRTIERPFSTKPGPVPGTQLGRPKAPGSRNGAAVLLEEDVRRMRQQAADGVPNYQLAAEYGIAPATVSRIVNRKTWTHV